MESDDLIFFAEKKDGKFYHFYDNLMAYIVICGLDDKISKVSLKASTEEDAYWGWKDENGRISMIFPAEFLFNMCFPSGYKICVERGQGEVVRFSVTELETKTRREWDEDH